VGIKEIAQLTGLTPVTVRAWPVRHSPGSSPIPFPEPRGTVSGHRAWLWGDVRDWLVATDRGHTLNRTSTN